ncbi:MAG: polyprenyl synthetase family protein [Planctomycetota bacterium]|nr:polyprenyl synthetase family protein [Planctomycetota bacterium]
MTTGHTMHESDLFSEPAAMVEAALTKAIEAANLPAHLREAADWGVLGGKRLRPTLMLMSCRAVGGTIETSIPAAVALELIHCFSLIHDDLPALDNDALRRGQPTLHVKAGEAMAILAGDLMISLAFQQLTQLPVEPSIACSLVSELAGGTTSMVIGQIYDTLGGLPGSLEPREQLQLVHRNKTGALLRAACRMGGFCGGADEASMECLTAYGDAVGLMFQVVDDLLDVTQTAEHIGKATNKDHGMGKLTYPGLLGVEESRRVVKELEQRAIDALQPLGSEADPLRDLGRFMAIRTK